MPRFYKKTALGFMSEAEDPDDPEVTEVRLTADEFQRLREQIARFRKEAEVARSDAARQEVDARRRIDRELTDHKRKVDAQADSIVAEARREVEVCELVIESQKEQLEKVKAELRNEEIRTVLGDIGVASYIIEADKDTSCDCQPSDHDEGVNRLYRVQYMANYKTGYWEITIYNTKSIQVPENRLPIKLVRV